MTAFILSLLFLNQIPLLNESFTGTEFPPAGWDTLRSDTTMNTWYRYYYSTGIPDVYQARVRVYEASNPARSGWTTLKTAPVNLAGAAGQESLFFWYRFSLDANNLGSDDTMYVDISNNETDWINLVKFGPGADTNVWQTARLDLQPFDTYASACIRFHYVDRPNDSLATFNCNFWLDSVQVVNYDTIPETVVINELCPDPRTIDHNANNNFSNLDEEYIELFNATNSAISVAYNAISTGPGMLTIPDGFTIPDSGYVLLYASGELLVIDRNGNVTQSGTWLGTWPELDNEADTVRLIDGYANNLDVKGYTSLDVFPDCAIARIPDGSYGWMGNALATPGRSNGSQYIWPMAYAFRDLDSNFVPDEIGSGVTVTGVITAPPGIYSASEAYMQDYTGGVCLFGNYPVPLDYGDSLLISGTVDQYRGKSELTNLSYSVVMHNATMPEPIKVNGMQLNTEQYEGCLVSVKVMNFDGLLLEGNHSYNAWDTLDYQFTVWIDSYTNIPGSLVAVDTFTLIGIKGQYTTSTPPNNGHQLMPRTVDDFSHMFTPLVMPIGEVQQPGPDGVSSKYTDSIVTIEGIVTGPNYVFTTGSPSFYVQDSTGGINIYNASGDPAFIQHADSLGARLRITGTVTEYRGLTEIAHGYGWFLGMDTVPWPRQILPNWVLTEGMESFLVQLTGVIVTTPYQTGDGYNMDVLNGDAGITVRFTGNSGINPYSIPKDVSRVLTGIVGQYDPESPYTTGYQLLLRFPSDIADPQQDTSSAEPVLEIATHKTFIPSAGEQAQIRINAPYDHRLELDIHDMSGRVVRRLYSGAGGPNTIYWNGRDDLARPCKVGIYLLNLKARDRAGILTHKRALIVIGTR